MQNTNKHASSWICWEADQRRIIMRLENGAMHLEAGLSGPNRADVRDNHPLVSSSLRDLARHTTAGGWPDSFTRS